MTVHNLTQWQTVLATYLCWLNSIWASWKRLCSKRLMPSRANFNSFRWSFPSNWLASPHSAIILLFPTSLLHRYVVQTRHIHLVEYPVLRIFFRFVSLMSWATDESSNGGRATGHSQSQQAKQNKAPSVELRWTIKGMLRRLTRFRLLKGLIAYPEDKATIIICILTKCFFKDDKYIFFIYNSIR